MSFSCQSSLIDLRYFKYHLRLACLWKRLMQTHTHTFTGANTTKLTRTLRRPLAIGSWHSHFHTVFLPILIEPNGTLSFSHSALRFPSIQQIELFNCCLVVVDCWAELKPSVNVSKSSVASCGARLKQKSHLGERKWRGRWRRRRTGPNYQLLGQLLWLLKAHGPEWAHTCTQVNYSLPGNNMVLGTRSSRGLLPPMSISAIHFLHTLLHLNTNRALLLVVHQQCNSFT